ncbi:MAG: hypothetical protein JJ992_21290, partial [Planctomycetes bacterium]|nr:hypothetical protein [Planctomycetota bacterium]
TGADRPAADSTEAEYLSRFSLMPDLNAAADAPSTLEATWRMAREVEGVGGGEKEMLGRNFDPDAPPKFTRLSLFGVGGARALRGEFVCRQWGYHFTNLSVAMPPAESSTSRAFVALIQPYVGRPVLSDPRELAIEPNEDDARRAAAVEVKTTAGHTDVCFADGRPERAREIPAAGLKVAGEFALYSVDAQGLRQVTLVGGRSLVGPLVRIETETGQRTATITQVDYLQRRMWIEPGWPERHGESIVEVGVPGHWTTYTATAVDRDGNASRLSLLRGGDYFRSTIEKIDAAESTLTTTLRPLIEAIDHNRAGWVASDDRATDFWRATYLGAGRFRLDGATEKLSVGDAFRLWEYGVGDTVRQPTAVSLRRVGQMWELSTDIAVRVSLPIAGIEISRDGTTWHPAGVESADGWITVDVSPADNPLHLRPHRLIR